MRPRESGTEASREGRRVRIGVASGIGGASEASHCSEPMNRSFSTKTSSCSPCSSGFAAAAAAVAMLLGFALASICCMLFVFGAIFLIRKCKCIQNIRSNGLNIHV